MPSINDLKRKSPVPDNAAKDKLVLLGVGQVALHLADLAKTYKLIGTTRDKNKIEFLEKASITPFLLESDFAASQKNQFANLLQDAYVLVSFPPDGYSDKLFSALCQKSKAIIYISSTSVYGNYIGVVNEQTPVDEQDTRSKLRLQAEEYWRHQGAIILRAPGLYGPQSGLHLRLANGSYRLPPINDNYISRIHLHDLARIILAAFAKPLPAGSTYIVGDLKPTTQLEIIEWLSQKMELAMPAKAAPDQVSISLTSNRRIEAKKILDELKLELQYPTYKEGYTDCLKQSALNFCDLEQ